ncbi:hypothetical protein EYF80_027661 [Liparis tanakae]|uniref:Uncharacterized protein n=1 Tax=Liparis tanakae TaxID=230148 RepID=A0A4Z2H963_9TELE|nr:hypothetical protein EYF80_027661 [Liparis tanakae]
MFKAQQEVQSSLHQMHQDRSLPEEEEEEEDCNNNKIEKLKAPPAQPIPGPVFGHVTPEPPLRPGSGCVQTSTSVSVSRLRLRHTQ